MNSNAFALFLPIDIEKISANGLIVYARKIKSHSLLLVVNCILVKVSTFKVKSLKKEKRTASYVNVKSNHP